jgi:hypothetical protein
MPLVRQRPLLFTLTVVGAVAALVATILLTTNPGGSGGPELAAPGANHYQVSAEDSANGPVAVGNGVFVGAAVRHDVSPHVRDLAPKPVRALPAGDEEGEGDGDDEAGSPNAPDTVVQSTLATPNMPSTLSSFDGIAFPGVSCNCAPPDTNGEVGLTQYVQVVNEGFQVWNKSTGASVYGPAGLGTIWSGFGGVCETSGHGDPVVLYDQLANRWLISQFAGASVPTDECIAISQTSDATGAWYRYGFHLGSSFYDYPHLSVWPDGYYMSMNVFNSSGTSFVGPQAFVFDRTRMLAGLSATFQTKGNLGSNVETFLPADLDGSTLPPAGAPATFVDWPGAGHFNVYHYKVDWANPASSTWTTFATPSSAGFTALCPTTRSCVPQAGTTSRLDGLADRLMFRLAYRNFGDHESVVGNFTVSSGSVAGIRWFELRNVTAGPVTVYQQATYQPDSTWRWMGSIAMDGAGNIALGFSASSGTINPQLRYAGRLASDPLGQLAQGEATLYAGTGSQTGTSSRWGDYADMTVDPVDDCTFWFTSEYYSTTTSFNWRTRIGSFTMPGCSGGGGGPTTGSIGGQVTDSVTHAALSGATVSISGGPSTTTDGSGNYSFTGLAPATYSVTASKTGYVTSSAASVPVTAGATTTANFALVAVAPVVTTAYFYVTSSVAGSGGDGNGYESSRPNLVGSPDGTVASDVNSGTAKSTSCTSTARDSEVATFAPPSVSGTIRGIQVQLTGRASSSKNSPRFCVQLSWDGGSTWTTGKSTGNLTTSLATYTLGTTSDTWGHSWTTAQLGGANLRVRIIDLASSTARNFYLDAVGVAITYQ